MSGMTDRQVDALFGIKMGAPGGDVVLDVRPVLRGWWQVTAPDGTSWLVDESGGVEQQQAAA